ncbi:tryptophan-rich sensory protein TspO [Roseicitreum antarcticum]|uniref:TspO and MBR related proteins n=1 Tax=Roseicitreum antarcticum TaxID=564137 RepID=A0A1H2QJD2_9RHOB|nr:TspO/MBR family protein [Roseicitreum antarcticum]SDW07261.1 TspO and MBR related proteins [Roseicitreum antarcticum]
MDWTLFAIFFAASIAAASTGALFEPGAWYKGLDKPRWTPPNWLFPVVWTVLYIAMAVAAARIAVTDAAPMAMAFYTLQLVLNTLWTPVFFGLRRLGGGMLVISGLWLAVAATTVTFWQIDTVAGLLLAPYLLWASIAGALNFSVWRRNPGAGGKPAQ